MKTIHTWLLAVALVMAAAAPAAGQPFGQSGATISANGADCSVAARCVQFKVDNVPAFRTYLNFGTSATLHFEFSMDDGPTAADGTWETCGTDDGCPTVPTADGSVFIVNTGFRRFRIRASALNGSLVVGTPSRGLLGNTSSSSGGAGDASASKQDEQTALLTTINAATDALADLIDMMSGGLKNLNVDAAGDPIPLGDGGLGLVSANTSRIVGANIARTYDNDADENKLEIDDDGGVFCGFAFSSVTTADTFMQVFDADADDVTVGTTSPTDVYVIPAMVGTSASAGVYRFPGDACYAYTNALTVAATTTRTGSTGPAALVAITVYTR